MEEEILENSKESFIDTFDIKSYVNLQTMTQQYKNLKSSIQKPLKMVLIYGKPGTGKSMLLTKLYKEFQEQTQEIFLYTTPLLDEESFFSRLGKDILQLNTKNMTQFVALLENKESNNVPIVLLDEAQLYDDNLMEKIRLLCDTRKIKFVLTLHKTEQEDLIAKEHFQTRIWESIELTNATQEELKLYITQKLIKAHCYESANLFDTKAVQKIYTITQGNLRESNKLLYTIFELYLAYTQHNMLHKVSFTKLSTKMIEMAALQRGMLHD